MQLGCDMDMFMGQLNCLLNHLSKGRLSDHTCLYLNYSPRLTSETNRLFPGTARDQHRSSADWSSPENVTLSSLIQKGVGGECLRSGYLSWGHLYPSLLHLPGSSPLLTARTTQPVVPALNLPCGQELLDQPQSVM